MFIHIIMPKDYYKILGLNKGASDSEIKKAYRKLSVKWHPDKNPNNKEEATRQFQEISEAYSILSDSEKRQQYDQVGMDFVNNQSGGQGFDPSDIMARPEIRQQETRNQANMVSAPYEQANRMAAEKTNPMNAESQDPGRVFLMKFIGKE